VTSTGQALGIVVAETLEVKTGDVHGITIGIYDIWGFMEIYGDLWRFIGIYRDL